MIDIIKGKKIKAYDLLDILINDEDFRYEPPINIYTIAKKLDCDINYASEHTSLVSKLNVKKGKSAITINKTYVEGIAEERFIVAHEIGHLCLHIAPKGRHAFGEFIDTNETLKQDVFWEVKEYEANIFAAQLLMPKDLIIICGQKIVNEYIKSFKNKMPFNTLIQKLAEQFEVSCQVMEYRVKNLGIINV
jgi:Zn-dependent peptidase ImmA (M78 family)